MRWTTRRMVALTVLSGALAAAATVALAQPRLRVPLRPALRRNRSWTPAPPEVRQVPIENPAALARFHRALRALAADPSRRVRVLHYGDSNVAADLWTHVTRETLQRRFGGRSSGYLMPRGHGSWHRGPVQVRTEGQWVSRRRGFGRDFGPSDGAWGLAGVGVEPQSGGGARIVATVPEGRGRRVFELHLLGRARPPGAVEVQIDEQPRVRIHTRLDRPGLILRRWELDAGEHRVRIHHVGGRPRVLGLVVEEASGVIYDVLGINGHRASAINHWDTQLMREQLRHRRPDLIVLSYGGNEALDPNLPVDAYERQTRRAITTMRVMSPRASCLIVGPLASIPTYAARMQAITDAQRRMASDLDCAFWDSSQTSGGHGTLQRWLRHPGMVSGDRLHLGRLGYERVGEVFVNALLAEL